MTIENGFELQFQHFKLIHENGERAREEPPSVWIMYCEMQAVIIREFEETKA